MRAYIAGNTGLTFEQYANADMNKDGEVKLIDYVELKQLIDGNENL